MITGVHAIIFTRDADQTRAFFRDTEITDERWGVTTTLELPGGGQVALYQPSHPSPLYPTS